MASPPLSGRTFPGRWGFILTGIFLSASCGLDRKGMYMGRKLYVGNLSYSVTKETLEELFGKVGKVESVSIITDKYSGQPRGFGFVEMSSQQEAEEAIKQLNGQMLGDREIVVNEARAEERKGGGGGGRGFGGGGGGRGGGGGGRGGGEKRRRY